MSQQLQNKNIVIIGGTTGIGFSAAKAFIDQGAKVVVTGRNEENVEKAKAGLAKMHMLFVLMQGKSHRR